MSSLLNVLLWIVYWILYAVLCKMTNDRCLPISCALRWNESIAQSYVAHKWIHSCLALSDHPRASTALCLHSFIPGHSGLIEKEKERERKMGINGWIWEEQLKRLPHHLFICRHSRGSHTPESFGVVGELILLHKEGKKTTGSYELHRPRPKDHGSS